MKDIYKIVKEYEANLEDFINWQIANKPTNNFRHFAETTGKAQDIFKYAAILYPKFISIEDMVVLSDHYSKSNWDNFRKTRDARSTANIINHVHIEDFLLSDYNNVQKVEDALGDLLVFFWQMAVNHQFQDKKILVQYDGGVINIIND